MKLTSLTGTLESIFNTGIGITVLTLGIGGGMTGAIVDWANEPLDTSAPTEKTAQLLTEMEQSITDMTIIKAKQNVLEAKHDLNELVAGGDLKVGSEAWTSYTVDKATLEDGYTAQANEFSRQIVTNSEIPENKSARLIELFNTKGLETVDVKLPSEDSVYALHEMQAENPSLDTFKINTALAENSINDGKMMFMALPFGIIGFFAALFVAGVTEDFDRYARNKPSKKPRQGN